jgi:hypothetical protein
MSLHSDDGTLRPDNGLQICIEYLCTPLIQMERSPPTVQSLKDLLEKAGFEDIKAVEVKEPVGPWPKDPTQKKIGAMVMLNGQSYAESHAMAPFTRVLGMDAVKGRKIIDESQRNARNKNYHTMANSKFSSISSSKTLMC